MITVIKVALIVGLVLVLFVVGVVFFFIRIARKAIKAAATASGAPCRINLEPELNPQWRNAKEINEHANQLRALGFEDVGVFSIPELGGLMILGLIHPSEGLLGVIYDHAKMAPSIDICADFTDGTTVSAASSAIGDSLDKRPNHPILWLGTTDAKKLLQAVQNHKASAPRKAINKDEFTTHFKRSYAESVNWRLKKGGASREEVRRQAEKNGHALTEEQIEQSYQNLHEAYLEQLQTGCIAQYLDEQKMSPDNWERIQPQTFAIPETLELKEVIETISNNVKLDDEQRHQLEKIEKSFGENAINTIEKILNQNIATLRLEKLGEVKEPVSAIILKAPVSLN